MPATPPTSPLLRGSRFLSSALIAVVWLWFLDSFTGSGLLPKTYIAIASAAFAVSLAGRAFIERHGRPGTRVLFALAAGGLLAACATMAVSDLSGSLVLGALAMAIPLLLYFGYGRSLGGGMRVLVPLELLGALILAAAVALPILEQRGQLAAADPILARSVWNSGEMLAPLKWLVLVTFHTFNQILGFPPTRYFILLFFLQRLLLTHAPGGAAAARSAPLHSAAHTTPALSFAAPALVGLATVAAATAAVLTPLASNRPLFATLATSGALLLLTHFLFPGNHRARRPALEIAILVPFLAAAHALH